MRCGVVGRPVIAVLVLLAAAAGGGLAWRGKLSPGPEQKRLLVFERVKRGPLEITLIERGNLESANNVTLTCEVEGDAGAGILKIVEEGTRVQEGQVLVELDASRLRSDANAQQIVVERAAAALKNAEKDVEIQKTQSASDIAAAQLKLDLARLDLAKYEQGDLVQERNVNLGAIELAREDLTRAEEKYAFSQRLIRKGYAKQSEVEADRVAVEKAKINLSVAQEKLDVLDDFTSKRMIVEKQANALEFEREFERVKLRADAALAKLQADLSAARRKYAVEKARHDDILRQIAVCTIRAPRDGLVVYANTPRNEGGRRSSSNEPLIFEGAKVQQRQAIINLPDMRKMEVNARIHESKISMVHEGLSATIHVDAVSDRVFHGVVETISLVPMSANRRNQNLKEYSASIRFTDDPSTFGMLKPGLTAEVEILVDRLPAVLQAPVRSFAERGGRYFAWVLDRGSPSRREVKVGRSNELMMEVLEGLAEGEQVVQTPRALLPEEVALLEEQIPAISESAFATREIPPPVLPRQSASLPADRMQADEADRPAPGEASPAERPAGPGEAAPPDGRRRSPGNGDSSGGRDPLARFRSLDRNGDGQLSEDELPERMKRMLTTADVDRNKSLDKDEFLAAIRAFRGQRERGPQQNPNERE